MASQIMLCVVLDGKVINIGPWNHEHPFPDGATEGDFDVAMTSDGRYVLSNDYRAQRSAEYPSIGDQLDSLYRAGLFPPEMDSLIASVKARHPKQSA